MKIVFLAFCLFLSFSTTVRAQRTQPTVVSLRFRPALGGRVSYTVQNDIDITETSQGQAGPEQRAGSISHSMAYTLTVDSVGSGSIPSVLRLKIDRISFNDGNHIFDSANSSQM